MPMTNKEANSYFLIRNTKGIFLSWAIFRKALENEVLSIFFLYL